MIEQMPSVLDVEKPWGRFEQYTHNIPSTVKVITVRPGGALSLQYHHQRDELWVILDPGAQIELGDAILRPERGEKIFIPTRRPTGSQLSVTYQSGSSKCPSVSSTRTTSFAWKTSTDGYPCKMVLKSAK
jgi:hypothetical protein